MCHYIWVVFLLANFQYRYEISGWDRSVGAHPEYSEQTKLNSLREKTLLSLIWIGARDGFRGPVVITTMDTLCHKMFFDPVFPEQSGAIALGRPGLPTAARFGSSQIRSIDQLEGINSASRSVGTEDLGTTDLHHLLTVPICSDVALSYYHTKILSKLASLLRP